jgi:Rrf2 family protein
MTISGSVENALHLALILARLGPEEGLAAGKLAEAFGLSATSTAKLLQQMGAADLVMSREGRTGGYRLARSAAQISLLEIVLAADERAAQFQCREIRQQGACAVGASEYARPCKIAQVMARAELAWRKALASQSLADLAAQTDPTLSPAVRKQSQSWMAGALHTL